MITWTCSCGYARNFAHWDSCSICGALKPLPKPPQQPADSAPAKEK